MYIWVLSGTLVKLVGARELQKGLTGLQKRKNLFTAMTQKKVLVVGAGVLGLTAALEIKTKFPDYEVKIISKHIPGDYDIYYTSNWAGAQWSSGEVLLSDGSFGEPSEDIINMHKRSYLKFKELSKLPQTWIRPLYLYEGDIDKSKKAKFHTPWYAKFVDEYEFIGEDPVKFPGVMNIKKLSTFTISTTQYLMWLVNENLKLGSTLQRMSVESLDEASKLTLFSGDSKPDLIINCTGLLNNRLADNHDKNLYPIRGHTVLIENNLDYQVAFHEADPEVKGEFLMCFPRKEGGSVIGGIYDIGSWKTGFDKDYIDRLFAKCKKHLPELKLDKEKVKIVRNQIGFRPGRHEGTRTEIEKRNGYTIIHNYGCSNLGYIESWGLADKVTGLINVINSRTTKL